MKRAGRSKTVLSWQIPTVCRRTHTRPRHRVSAPPGTSCMRRVHATCLPAGGKKKKTEYAHVRYSTTMTRWAPVNGINNNEYATMRARRITTLVPSVRERKSRAEIPRHWVLLHGRVRVCRRGLVENTRETAEFSVLWGRRRQTKRVGVKG